MKTIKNRKTLKLQRVTNEEAKELVEGMRRIGDRRYSKYTYSYSTKGAWKSRQNTLKNRLKLKDVSISESADWQKVRKREPSR
jgi:hypothetical protein